MNPRAVSVKYKSIHKLIITFSDGKVKEFDLLPYLQYPVYHLLKNETFCTQAKVKDGIVVWNEEIDIDPDRLYTESKELRREPV